MVKHLFFNSKKLNMNFNRFLSSILVVLFLMGFYACDKTTNLYELTTKSKALTDENSIAKLNTDKTLVAIVLTDKPHQAKANVKSFERLLTNKGLNAEMLNKQKGEIAFFTPDNKNGFTEVQNLRQSKLTATDLSIDIDATSYSHLTTYQNTPVEVITYQPNDELLRVIDRGVGLIVIIATGRYPENIAF